MGLILTPLILTAPPIAAMFFQGNLGSYMAYSQIGGSPVAHAPGPSGQPPGSYYTPAQTKDHSSAPSVSSGHGATSGYGIGRSGEIKQDTGKYGQAGS